MSKVPTRLVVDTVLLISYLRGDELSDRAGIIDRALTKKTLLLVSSEMYDDLITAYRTGGTSRMRLGTYSLIFGQYPMR